jgi:hypothetical protein
MVESKEIATIKASATNLKDPSGWFGSIHPMIYISRSMENGGFQRVYKSDYVSGKNCSWPQFEIPIATMCNCDYARPLRVEVWHYKRNGSHVHIGGSDFSL